MPVPVGLIASGVGMGLNAIKNMRASNLQSYEDSILESKRPKLGLTTGTQEMVDTARNRTNAEMPGANQVRRMQQTSMANLVSSARRTAGSSGDLLQIAAGASAQEAELAGTMAVAQDQYTDQATRDYMASLNILSEEEKEMFDYNQNMPFQRKLAERQARMIAENQMKSQQFTNMTSLLASLISSDMGATGVNTLIKFFQNQNPTGGA